MPIPNGLRSLRCPAKTIATLRHLFATYGLPEQVVSDNGPQFTSEEFRQFLKSNRVRLFTTHRDRILQELHRDHPGSSRMKSVAR